MRKIIFLLMLLHSGLASQSTVRGRVVDIENEEPIEYATVAIYKGGNLIGATESNSNGFFIYNALEGGIHTVVISQLNHKEESITSILWGKNDDVLNLYVGLALSYDYVSNTHFKDVSGYIKKLPHHYHDSDFDEILFTEEGVLKWNVVPVDLFQNFIKNLDMGIYQRKHNSPQILLNNIQIKEDAEILHQRSIIDGWAYSTEERGKLLVTNGQLCIRIDSIKNQRYTGERKSRHTEEIELNKSRKLKDEPIQWFKNEWGSSIYFREHCFYKLNTQVEDHDDKQPQIQSLCDCYR